MKNTDKRWIGNMILDFENDILEIEYETNFALVFKKKNLFQLSQYKPLQNQKNGFVKCMKANYNGCTEIYYLTNGMQSLRSLLPKITSDQFCSIVSNLFANLKAIDDNGFLKFEKIIFKPEKIFVNTGTYSVSFIYVPISENIYDNRFVAEAELKTMLVKAAETYDNISSAKVDKMVADLMDGSLKFQDLYMGLLGQTIKSDFSVNLNKEKNGEIRLVSLNLPSRVELKITKDDFVVGKNPNLSDGVISFNKMISRKHCRFIKRDNVLFVEDLQSSNGTFINKKKLLPGKQYQVNSNDVIRLANSDFQLIIT